MTTCQAVSLVRYAERIGYRECAFFGINHPDNIQWECREIWSQVQRQMVADALAEAQDLIEQELGYPLCPRWFTDERHVYARPIETRWGYVIAGGVMSDTMIADDEAVDYSCDPAIVGPIDPGSCPVGDLHLYHHGTDEEIIPSDMQIDAVTGEVTFSIPWCRLVAPAYQDNPEAGWLYTDVATWGADTVDVRCIANDPSTQAKLIVAPGANCSDPPCTDTQYDACIYMRRSDIGSVSAHRADYADGVWIRKTLCYRPSWIEINYQAGLTELSRGAEDAIIRLAHSLMPDEPCGCQVTQALWRRDRNTPQVLTRERINCPWGLSDGAWYAWKWAQGQKLVRGSVL